MKNDLPQPGRYEHYKGKFYRVIGVARHSETAEDLVVYQALYGERGLWARPLKNVYRGRRGRRKNIPASGMRGIKCLPGSSVNKIKNYPKIPAERV